MFAIESFLVELALLIFDAETLNAFWGDPRTAARVVGAIIAVSAGTLGSYLLLRGSALTSDAISHTVLLGIVVAFLIMTDFFGMEPNLSSPWLIIGAATAGVLTVLLTEAIESSGLIKQDAALGLAFPLLFAIAILLVSRYTEDVHLDEDAVLLGEIGVAWADTTAHTTGEVGTIVITPEDPRATVRRECINCESGAISPRDSDARFQEVCSNCGSYTVSEAWRAGLLSERPTTVYWPRAVTVNGFMLILTLLFLLLFYKELKIATFDPGLARSLGIRTRLLSYTMMVIVSLVAVAAFDAVGSILVVAFFIIPPASAFLLTKRLSWLLLISGALGALGAYWGYDLARGSLFGVVDLPGSWDTSISAAMVLMMLFLFFLVFLLAPANGLLTTLLRRRRQSGRFREMVILGNIANHGSANGLVARVTKQSQKRTERAERRTLRLLRRLEKRRLLKQSAAGIELTAEGARLLERFRTW